MVSFKEFGRRLSSKDGRLQDRASTGQARQDSQSSETPGRSLDGRDAALPSSSASASASGPTPGPPLPLPLTPAPASATIASSGSLSLHLFSPTTISPGSTLAGQVTLPTSILDKDATSVSLNLSGKSGATIMLKQRWQLAVAANTLGGGAGAGGAVPLTYRETHTFLRCVETLWSKDGGSGTHGNNGAISPGTPSPSPSSAPGAPTTAFHFEIEVPRIKQCTCTQTLYGDSRESRLPPSCNLRDAGLGQLVDQSTIEIFYTLSATVERRGMLKRNMKAKIPLTLVSDEPPNYLLKEELAGTNRSPTKYAAKDDAAPPDLECQLSFTAPTARGTDLEYAIRFRIVEPREMPEEPFTHGSPSSPSFRQMALSSSPPYSPSWPRETSGLANEPFSTSYGSTPDKIAGQDGPTLPPLYQVSSNPLSGAALLPQIKPRFEVHLLRQCTTRPVERPADGQMFHWSAYTLVAGKHSATREGDLEGPPPSTSTSHTAAVAVHIDATAGEGVVRGILKIPEKEVSLTGEEQACNAKIKHFVAVRLLSDAIRRPVVVKVPVYLPSNIG